MAVVPDSIETCSSSSTCVVILPNVVVLFRSLAFRLSKSLKVIGTDTDRLATYDFLLVIRSNQRLSCTVSEINGDFVENRKQKKFTHMYLMLPTPAKGFPLNFRKGSGAQKTRIMAYTSTSKTLMLCPLLCGPPP